MEVVLLSVRASPDLPAYLHAVKQIVFKRYNWIPITEVQLVEHEVEIQILGKINTIKKLFN